MNLNSLKAFVEAEHAKETQSQPAPKPGTKTSKGDR
jgi:hypothetical protein